jgi:hypothetical protein
MRARNIKPSTFTNDLLAFAAPIHTVIFAGLWCIADRRGVLLDSPSGIHILINPGRSASSTRNSLSWLEEHGFIIRYQSGNLKLIKILKFTKHQNPHKDEKASELPEPSASTVPAPKPARGSNGGGTVPDRENPEPTGLIPSSLIPDCSLRDSEGEKRDFGKTSILELQAKARALGFRPIGRTESPKTYAAELKAFENFVPSELSERMAKK